MKSHILKSIFLFAILFIIQKSHAQTWSWAKSSSGSSNYYTQNENMATDASGNVYLTGYFSTPTITFGSITLTNSGLDDIFLVKYDASGNVLWAKSANGSMSDQATAVATDPSGNVYLTGDFVSNALTFGTTTITNTIMSSYDIFIVKYDPSGNVIWAKHEGGQGDDYATAVTTDASGKVYISGYFSSPSLSFGTHSLTNSGANDIFFAAYDGSGNSLWANNPTGTANETTYSIAADALGNLYATGIFLSSSINFGSFTLNCSGSCELFVVKYDNAGNVLWAKNAGGGGYDVGFGIAVDGLSSVYVTGWFHSLVITFGSFTLTKTGFSNYSADMFLARYDASGNVLWAKNAGGVDDDRAYSTATFSGDVYVTGTFDSTTIVFGTDTLVSAYPTSNSMFIVGFDQAGNAFCAGQLPNQQITLTSVATDVLGDIYVSSSYTVDPLIVGADTLHLSGVGDVFIAKYNCALQSVNESLLENEITIYPNPSNGKFQLEINNFSTGNNQVEIYNAMGKIILMKKIDSEKTELDLSSQAPGIYFVRFISDNKIHSAKIIIQ